MVRSTGWAIHHTSKTVHRLLLLSIALLVMASCLLAVSAWRLAQGPIDVGWLSNRLRAALIDDAEPVHLRFDGVSLAWEGFHEGVNLPLDLRLSNIAVTDATGRRLVEAPRAHLTLSLAGLVLGRIVPHVVEVDHAQIAVTRDPGGAFVFGSSPAASGATDIGPLLGQLSHAPETDHRRTPGWLDQLQRAHFRDTNITFLDRNSGLVATTQGMDIDLIAAKAGRLHGSLQAPLSIGDQRADLTARFEWANGSGGSLELKLTPLRPSGIGRLPPIVAKLASLDLPVALTATVAFDAALTPTRVQAQAQVGQGQILVDQGRFALRSGVIALSGTPDAAAITGGYFDVAPTASGKPQIVEVNGTVARAADRLTASLTIGLSQIDIADLPLHWPAGIDGEARSWVVQNVTAGIATHGTVHLVAEADDALHDVVVTQAAGDLDVANATFTWIDNVPPVQQANAHLHLVDPDTLDIHVSTGRQSIRNGAPDLLIQDGQMRITGLSARDQNTVIRAQIEGPVASALALLKEPRLHLLSEHPIDLKTGGGTAAATLNLRFPLENKLRIDDVDIHARAHLANVLLLDVVGGHDLKDGAVDLEVDKDGLSLKGQASLADVPVVLDGTMDFRPGPADRIMQKIVVTGQPDGAQLDAAGLHVSGFVTGPVPLKAVTIERQNGVGSVTITGDLTPATLSIAPLAWTKSANGDAAASATLLLSHGRLTKIDRITLRADGLSISGSADFTDGQIRSVLLDTIHVGLTQGHGTLHFAANQPIAAVLQGEQIDLEPALTAKVPATDHPKPEPVKTPEWTLDAHFNRAILANGEFAADVLVKATGGGQMIRLLDTVGSINTLNGKASSAFSIRITPKGAQRNLLIDAKDAGGFLRGIDLTKAMQSGHLTADGVFNAPIGMSPLAGTATIDSVVVRNSPILGKLLQAITLYGLVDALRGPGIDFGRVVVPFRYDGDNVDLIQAHADNPSLGLTAKGRIGISSRQTAITGTIVPAYFFNAMLGNLPLVGKLFSPEEGGGVFAARFGLDGPIDDPSISINPISVLTPGFLREIFGIFDRAPPPASR